MKTKQKPNKWHERTAVSLLIVFLGVAVVFGFLHVITSSTLSLPHMILKDSFGYSETFINIDKITGMPWLAAKAKYPIGCRVLAEKGYIETDKEFHERVEREMDAELKEAQAKFMKEYDEFMK